MRWFQHSIGSHDDSDIADARDRFGDFGYSGFFIILEIYAEEFNHINGEQFIDISRTFLRRKLRKSWTNVRLLLDFYQTKNRIYYKTEGDRVFIKVPKFITLVDNWTRRPKGKNSVVATEQLPNEDKTIQDNTLHKKIKYTKEDTYLPLLNHWNSLEIIIHKKLTASIKTKIKSTLKDFSEDNIKDSMSNYAKVITSNKHYFNHKWTLEDFLQRGLVKFLNEADPLNNFLTSNRNKKKEVMQTWGEDHWDIPPDIESSNIDEENEDAAT